jgi:hypothetical protein
MEVKYSNELELSREMTKRKQKEIECKEKTRQKS